MKVLVAEKIAPSGIEKLKEQFEVEVKTDLTPEQLVAEIPAYDALIVRSATKATREVIEAGVNLKIIGRAGVGVDNVDVELFLEQVDPRIGDLLRHQYFHCHVLLSRPTGRA